MSRCKFSFNLCIVTTGWNSNSNQGEWGQYSDGTEHPRERFTQWWYLHTASMTLPNIQNHKVKFEIDKHYRHKKGLSPKKLMPCFVQIDDLVFTFCSSQSHQGSNFQGSGSHDRKNWSHVSSSYSNVLFIRLSISFVLCLTMPISFCKEWIHVQCPGNYVLKSFKWPICRPAQKRFSSQGTIPKLCTGQEVFVYNISLYFWALCVSNFYQF